MVVVLALRLCVETLDHEDDVHGVVVVERVYQQLVENQDDRRVEDVVQRIEKELPGRGEIPDESSKFEVLPRCFAALSDVRNLRMVLQIPTPVYETLCNSFLDSDEENRSDRQDD